MSRVFWMALGATAGVLVVRRVTRAAQAYTPEGIGRSLTGALDAIRDLAEDVRAGMAEREQELRVALGIEAGTMEAGDAVAAAPAEPAALPAARRR